MYTILCGFIVRATQNNIKMTKNTIYVPSNVKQFINRDERGRG